MAGLYSLLAIGNRVTGTGVLDSHHASLQSIAKNNEIAKYCIANEYICAEIGRVIGLPIPPCGIVYTQGHPIKYWFASLNFNLSGEELPPIDPQKCAEELPDLTTGLILFDILIANPDRHRKNVSIDLNENPPRMSVFDHSHALFGIKNEAGIQRLADLKDKLAISAGPDTEHPTPTIQSAPYIGVVVGTGQNRHCLLGKLKTDEFFSKWCERISTVPPYLIEDVCRGTFELKLITAQEADAAKEFLIHRKSRIRSLVDANRIEFAGIDQWSIGI